MKSRAGTDSAVYYKGVIGSVVRGETELVEEISQPGPTFVSTLDIATLLLACAVMRSCQWAAALCSSGADDQVRMET